ncbi:MAG TPA: sigma 54-interacting transcriptional regulator, partial [Longimicrobium sp.]|nr:sigma 54-interacting transcriptional regulator [Longimicrobium sp.]
MAAFCLAEEQDEVALDIHNRSVALWGESRATTFIGHHPRLADTLAKVRRFGASSMPVLITGETGTGKELFARTLFLSGTHHRRAFLSVNCAQYSMGDLLASELFGHKKGSFTGAVADRRGIFEEADGGTVFLDEVGELPLNAQAMLLRALSEGEIIPVGSTQVKRVDVRIVAATSRDLEPMITAGAFRADLYYRLRYLRVAVPPLRERGDDWELIARHYLRHFGDEGGVYKELAADALLHLRAYPWPGNVREVMSLVETGYHLSRGQEITLADLGEGLAVQEREERAGGPTGAAGLCAVLAGGEETFWDLVHGPFMDRELNRGTVRELIGM